MRYLTLLLIFLSSIAFAQSEAGYLIEAEKYVRDGKIPQGIRAFENALRINPQSFTAALRLAEVYASLQDYRNAILFCNTALDITDNMEREFSERKEKLAREGATPEQLENWDLRLKRIDKERASVHQLKGVIRKYQGRKEDGLEEMKRGALLDPDNHSLVVDMAVLSFDIGHVHEAEALFHRAIALKPDHSSPYLNLGHIWRQRVQPDSALHYYKAAMNRQPATHWPFLHAGDIYAKNQQWENALKAYSRAIDLQPEGEELYYKRALVHYAREAWALAEEDWTSSLLYEAENPDTYTNRGLCRLWQEKLTEAIMDFTVSIALQPSNNYAFANRGYAYYLNREYKLAMEDLDEVIRQHPNYAHGYYYRALIWQARGKKKQACRDVKKAHFMGLSIDKIDDSLIRLCNP
jgi:tetratricopeptide (TPR) repeat protein